MFVTVVTRAVLPRQGTMVSEDAGGLRWFRGELTEVPIEAHRRGLSDHSRALLAEADRVERPSGAFEEAPLPSPEECKHGV